MADIPNPETVLSRSEYLQWKVNPTVETMPEALLLLLKERGIDPATYAVEVSTAGRAPLTGTPTDGEDPVGELDAQIVTGSKLDSEAGVTLEDESAGVGLEQALDLIRSGRSPQTPEEQAAFDDVVAGQSETAIRDFLAGMTGNVDPRAVSWMFDGSTGIGMTIDNIDWDKLYRVALMLGGDDIEFPERMEGQTDEEYKRQTIMGLMAAGPNPLNQMIWRTTLESTGNWASSFKIDDWYASDLVSIADQNKIDLGEATYLARVGDMAGLEPAKAAEIWAWAKDSGIDMWSLGDDLEIAPKDNVPFYDASERARQEAEQETNYDRFITRDKSVYMGPMGSEGGAFGTTYKTKYSHRDVFNMYQEAVSKYNGSESVARVSLHDEALAERMFNDPYSLSMDELRTINNYVGGVENIINSDPAGGSWLQERLLGSSKDIVKVDKDGAREAARQLAAGWNMPGLSDSQLDRIVQGVVGPQLAVIRQGLGNPFNPTIDDGVSVVNTPSAYAVAAKELRGSQAYKELFANLRDGESEEAYAGRFSAESNELLGDKSLTAARAGMRTGDRNTVGQNILLSGEGSDSSRFRERLAKLGNAFKDLT